ncbi:Membrane-associated phospholipid phosphatase [Collimonas arenae]|uniref:Membrane-associated phospholipid phosphatase n=1 Tax=Collimonas arenae TaxID=279058 RepID=A0A0A1FF47_9BURK|nr:phosphatase PAP2 family protein [Collimonas arenae]AIY42254.1 Membrane-associated phospholipid phosphatase [Collimonas arenae]
MAGRAWRLASLWFALFSIAIALVVVSKALFIGWGIGIQAIDFVGISGHTMLASAIFPTAAYLALHRHSLRLRIAAAGGACLLGLAVAISRVVLNAHSASEVIAGVALGFLVCISFIVLSRRLQGPHLSGAILLLAFGLLFAGLYGERLPTQNWIKNVALTLAGRERPFIREVWHRNAGQN